MTLLDANAIREIERLTLAGNTIVHRPSGESRNIYYLRRADGGLDPVEVPLRDRDVQVNDLTSLRLARAEQGSKCLAYYVSDKGVALDCESENHRHQVKLPLPTHPAFDIVSSWADGQGFEHKELVRLLRTKLRGYVEPSVVTRLENIKTSFAEDTSSSQTHAHSGLSRNVQREIRQQDGSELLPEFLVEVPVYDVPEYRSANYSVDVIVDYDHDRKQFFLTAVNDDLKKAREEAVDRVRSDLSDESLPVYYGRI